MAKTGLLARTDQAIGIFKRRAATYTRIAIWLLRDVFSLYRRTVFLVIALNGMAILSQIGAFGIIVGYARALETDWAFELFGWSITARHSGGLLTAVTLVTIGAMLVNAAILYRVRHATVKLSRQYEALCARRAFKLASQLPDPASPTASAMLMTEELSPLPEAEARACSRVLQQLVGLIPKLAVLVVSAGIVFYLNAALSGLILLIALVALYQLYHLNVSIAGLDQIQRERAPDIRKSRRFSKLFFRYSTAQFDGNVASARVGYLGQKSSPRYDRLESFASSESVLNIFSAVAVGIVIIFQGITLLRAEVSWGQLLIYLAALRLGLGAVMSCMSGLASISRFYTPVRRYITFITDAQGAVNRAELPADLPHLRLTVPSLAGGSPELPLTPEEPIAVLYSGPPDRHLAGLLADNIAFGKTDVSPVLQHPGVRDFWCLFGSNPVGLTLREAFLLAPEVTTEVIRQILKKQDDNLECQGSGQTVLDELEDIDEVIKDENTCGLTPALREALAAASAALSRRRFAMIWHEVAGVVLPAASSTEKPTPMLSFTVYNGYIDGFGTYGELNCIVVGDDDVMGWSSCDWLRQNPSCASGLVGRDC